MAELDLSDEQVDEAAAREAFEASGLSMDDMRQFHKLICEAGLILDLMAAAEALVGVFDECGTDLCSRQGVPVVGNLRRALSALQARGSTGGRDGDEPEDEGQRKASE